MVLFAGLIQDLQPHQAITNDTVDHGIDLINMAMQKYPERKTQPMFHVQIPAFPRSNGNDAHWKRYDYCTFVQILNSNPIVDTSKTNTPVVNYGTHYIVVCLTTQNVLALLNSADAWEITLPVVKQIFQLLNETDGTVTMWVPSMPSQGRTADCAIYALSFAAVFIRDTQNNPSLCNMASKKLRQDFLKQLNNGFIDPTLARKCNSPTTERFYRLHFDGTVEVIQKQELRSVTNNDIGDSLLLSTQPLTTQTKRQLAHQFTSVQKRNLKQQVLQYHNPHPQPSSSRLQEHNILEQNEFQNNAEFVNRSAKPPLQQLSVCNQFLFRWKTFTTCLI